MPGALGRIAPKTWEHVDKYPLTAPHLAEITVAPRPVVIGVNWYPEFDEPYQDSAGKWWLPDIKRGSEPRGGHSVCLKPYGVDDTSFWYRLYDQQNEGICVAEAGSRMSSLNNRISFQPRWLYDRCKEYDGEPYQDNGTYVNSAFWVQRNKGHVRRQLGEEQGLEPGQYDDRVPKLSYGISAYRWARSIDDVLAVLGTPTRDYVNILNSWGTFYPHYVRMSADTLERLWFEDGELGIATDR
jgi:hypothetical protein